MRNIAFVFAGQGSQYIGMGKELYEQFPLVQNIYKNASDVLGYDLIDLCVNGELPKLSQTEFAQPAIFTLSMACFYLLKEHGITPKSMAGFSLGEISAFCASDCVNLQDGFLLVKKRAEAMQRASKKNSGGMVAVLNVEPDSIAKECENQSGYVVPVNFNSPMQTVIAGEEKALEEVTLKLQQYDKAKCIKLNVSSAFHSKFMESAAEEFYKGIENISFKNPAITLYSDITGEEINTSDYRTYLKNQIISPVKWVHIINNMIQSGIDTFVELGSGKTLCGLIKKTDKNVTCFHVEDIAGLNQFLELK